MMPKKLRLFLEILGDFARGVWLAAYYFCDERIKKLGIWV